MFPEFSQIFFGPGRAAAQFAGREETRRSKKERFPIGSPGWVRADDIVAFNKNLSQNPLRK